MRSNTSSIAKESGRLDTALADAMRLVWTVLEQMLVEQRLLMITKCRAILDSVEARSIAAQLEAGVPTRKVEDLLHRSGNGGASKKTIKKKTKRGAVVRENPKLASKMASGELSDEQVDLIADASAQTNGEAANDTHLIGRIASAPPEQGKKLADKFVRDRQSQDDIDSAHVRAHKRRRVTRYTNVERGTDVLSIEGSAAHIDEIERRIDHLADRFYREDGGRDVAAATHRRSRDQRRFDAAHVHFTNGQTSADETRNMGEGGADPTEAERDAALAPQSTWKTTVVVRASLDQALGNDVSALSLADGKPLPTAVADRLACGANFVGQIFGADGEILWQGRSIRDATFAQRLALAVRDGGCVRCDAGLERSVVHHLIPWTSRMQGESNIDEMAMVCTDCHHHIHDNELTLFADSAGIWRLRPARTDEVAAKRAQRLDRQQRTKAGTGPGTFNERQSLILPP